MWEDGDDLTLENFQKAQERYIDHLISFIPQDVKTILDVGCGVGGNAIKLKEKGYDVTSLSPDLYQQQLFKERTGGSIPFVLSRLEDFTPDKKYDMILMSESVQYIPIDSALAKARDILKDGGYILSSDYYRLENSRGAKVAHLPSFYLDDYLRFAKEFKFEKLKEDDISDRAMKTLYYGNMTYGNYIKPTLKAVLSFIEVYFPPVFWMIRVFFKMRIKGEKVEQIIRNNIIPMKPEDFSKYMKYKIYLLKKQ
ncbi:class I SAM-dependent methyltransferase [Candidatus Margulisiibacteriota bacterium]